MWDDEHTVECPDCRVSMEPGCVPDFAQQFAVIPRWQAEEDVRPVAWFFRLMISGVAGRPIRGPRKEESIPITTYRCPECGLLRDYALDANETEN